MDKIDLQIIKELSEDARKPFRKIAKKIGISTQTVIKRYNEMKAKGIIQLCAITINIKKIGYEGTAVLLIRQSLGSNLSETIEEMKKIQNIIIVSKALGNFDGYAVLVFKNIIELREKVLKIKSLPEISHVEVSFAVPGIRIFPPNPKILINPGMHAFKSVNKNS